MPDFRQIKPDHYTDAKIAARVMPRFPVKAEDDVAKECRARVRENLSRTSRFREQRRLDREFIASQYSPEDLASRHNSRRPAMQMHIAEEKVEEVLSRWREAGIGFRVGSATSETGDDAAKAFNGLAQRDQRDSLSEAEMERAMQEATLYGESWLMWEAVSEHGGRPSRDGTPQAVGMGVFDKRLRLRCCDAENVFEDPTDPTPDRRDMNWLIETEEMTLEARNARFPDAKKLPAGVFDAGDEWFQAARDTTYEGPARDRRVVVAHYYRRRTVAVDWVWAPGFGDRPAREDRLTDEQQQLLDAAAPETVFRERDERDVVELFHTDGMFTLSDPETLPWGRIPYVHATGPEYKLPNGQFTRRGIVHTVRDPVKAISVGMSEAVYEIGIAGRPGWVAASEAIRDHRQSWTDTTKPLGVREWSAFSDAPGPQGERIQVPAPFYHSNSAQIAPYIEMIGVAREMIASSTGRQDANERMVNVQNRSAAAQDRLYRTEAAAHSSFIYRFEKITVATAGALWRMMAPYYYGRKGRILIISGESPGQPDSGWLVGIPFYRDPVTGAPVPATGPDGLPVPDHVQTVPWTNPATGEVTDRTLKVYRFDPGRDDVKVTTFASSLTAAGKDAMSEQLIDLSHRLPEQAAIAVVRGALRAMDDRMPVDAVLKEIDAVMPPPEDAEEAQDVTAMPAQIAQQQAQIQQMEQQLQELQAMADQTQAARDVAGMNAQKDQIIAQIRAASAEAVAQIRAQTDMRTTQATVEQRREEAAIKSATQADDADAERRSKAAIEGLKAGAAAAKQTPQS